MFSPFPCFPYSFSSHSSITDLSCGAELERGGLTGGGKVEVCIVDVRRRNSPPAKFSNDPATGVNEG